MSPEKKKSEEFTDKTDQRKIISNRSDIVQGCRLLTSGHS